MNRGIETTAKGMTAAQRWMDVAANNLANVSTTGFKRDALAFADLVQREMRSGGGLGPSLGSLGSGATIAAEYTVFETGPMQQTGRELDFAIDHPQGAFAVQTPQGVRYTRDGAFQLNGDRQLVTRDGYPVLDDGLRPVEIPFGKISMNEDGALAVNGDPVGRLGIYQGRFEKDGANLFTSADAALHTDTAIRNGTLEGSNVNAIESMVEMITVNRAFELAQRSITQQDELTQKLIQSLQDR